MRASTPCLLRSSRVRSISQAPDVSSRSMPPRSRMARPAPVGAGKKRRDMGFEKGGAVDRPMAGEIEPHGIGMVIEGKLRSLRHRPFSSRSEIRSRTQELAAQSAKITAWSSDCGTPLSKPYHKVRLRRSHGRAEMRQKLRRDRGQGFEKRLSSEIGSQPPRSTSITKATLRATSRSRSKCR